MVLHVQFGGWRFLFPCGGYDRFVQWLAFALSAAKEDVSPRRRELPDGCDGKGRCSVGRGGQEWRRSEPKAVGGGLRFVRSSLHEAKPLIAAFENAKAAPPVSPSLKLKPSSHSGVAAMRIAGVINATFKLEP